jgi:glucose/arabinose dehydrogenase
MTMRKSPRLALLLATTMTAFFQGACGDDDKPAATVADAGPSKDKPDGRVPGSDAGRSDGGSGPGAGTPDSGQPGDQDPDDAGVEPPVDSGLPCSASAAPTLPALKLEPVAGITGLNRIVYAAQPPGSSDWYLVQQTGTIHVLSEGALEPTPFLDVSAQVDANLGQEDERGLLGLAFPPDFATSNKFYIVITPTKNSAGFPVNSDSVVEYQAGAGAATRLRTIVQLPPSESNHNGGTVVFGPDGLLYFGTGDGGNGCNNNGEAGEPQSLAVDKLHGKILRFDPKVTTAPYAAAGNPFVGMADADPRVFHYGLRNPFRFGFDRVTGDMFIGDVGQDQYEEVDFAPVQSPGLNFGWPKLEGAHMDTCGASKQLLAGSTATAPIVDIPRMAGAPPPFGDYKSVIGGHVYRGSAIPQLSGVYLFGDYVGKRMGALTQCGSTTSKVAPINKNRDANAPNAAFFARAAGAPALDALIAIVEDGAGELYFVANRSSLLKVVAGP